MFTLVVGSTGKIVDCYPRLSQSTCETVQKLGRSGGRLKKKVEV